MFILEALNEVSSQILEFCLIVLCGLIALILGIVIISSPFYIIYKIYKKFGIIKGTVILGVIITIIIMTVNLVNNYIKEREEQHKQYRYDHSIERIVDSADYDKLCENLMNCKIDTSKIIYGNFYKEKNIIYYKTKEDIIDENNEINYGCLDGNNLCNLVIVNGKVKRLSVCLNDSIDLFKVLNEQGWQRKEHYKADTLTYHFVDGINQIIEVREHLVYWEKNNLIIIPFQTTENERRTFSDIKGIKINKELFIHSDMFILVDKEYYLNKICNKCNYKKYTLYEF